MSEKGMELLEQIMALEPAERRALAEEVLLRIEGTEEDEEMLRLATERWEHLQKNPTAWVSHDEVMRFLGD